MLGNWGDICMHKTESTPTQLSSYKNQLKLFKELNAKSETEKLLEETWEY